MSARVSKSIVAIAAIIGAWFGYWIGQPSISIRYWASATTTSTGSADFAWWSKYVTWIDAGRERRFFDYFADEHLYSLWRFLLAIGMAVLFTWLAAVWVERRLSKE